MASKKQAPFLRAQTSKCKPRAFKRKRQVMSAIDKHRHKLLTQNSALLLHVQPSRLKPNAFFNSYVDGRANIHNDGVTTHEARALRVLAGCKTQEHQHGTRSATLLLSPRRHPQQRAVGHVHQRGTRTSTRQRATPSNEDRLRLRDEAMPCCGRRGFTARRQTLPEHNASRHQASC